MRNALVPIFPIGASKRDDESPDSLWAHPWAYIHPEGAALL
jgi:hypothetical protein